MLTACPGPNNGNVTDDDKSQKIQVFSQEVGMSFISMVLKYTGDDTPVSWGINLYKADNLGKSLDYEYESYNKNVILKFDNRAGKIIDAGTEYIIKITMKDSNYDELTKNLSITTKAKGSPQIKSCTYESGTSPYVNVTYDEAPSFLKKLELWRSESEAGEYTKVNETTYFYSSLEIKDTKVNDSKTYYYKLKAYENTGSDSEPNYLLLGESNILSVETGIKKPFEVDETKITASKGIKSFTVTWPATAGATKYNIWLQKYRSSSYQPKDDDILQKYEVTGDVNSYQFKNLEPDTSYDFYITVTTAGGTSSKSYKTISTVNPTFKSNGVSKEKVKVTPGQDKATYKAELNFAETDGCEFYLTLRKGSSATSDVLYGIEKTTNTSFVVENLSPATYYSRYSSNNPTGYLHLTVKYTDADGQIQTKTDYTEVDYFTTLGLDAPSNVQFVESTANTATIKFDELTTKQKFGKTIIYEVSAYDSDNKLKNSTRGASSPITVNNLSKGQNYRFEVTSSFTGEDSFAKKDRASCYGATQSGITVKPVIKEITEVAAEDYHRGVRTNIQIKFDQLVVSGMKTEDFVYGIEYKIFEKSPFKAAQENFILDEKDKFIELTSEKADSGSFTQKFLVNGGNKYKVRVWAYNKEDKTDIVYSEVKEIQLNKIDDSVTFAALLYPQGNTIGATAGQMVEFTNPKVWEKETEIRSSGEKGYMIGYIQLMGQIESTKILFPKSQGVEWVNAKFNFTDALKADNIPRIILIDRSSFPFATNTYGYFNEVYITMPNEVASIIKTYKDDSENKKYIFQDFNMPYFDATTGKTSTHPSKAGIPVDESWIFNNSLYLGVKQTIPGDLGFSYYY